jgi:hypothetical protein
MSYTWIGERMAEDHRRDLAVARSEHRMQPGDLRLHNPHVQLELDRQPRPQVYALPGEKRRHIAVHVGTLLIRAGTRLGGATMRTS